MNQINRIEITGLFGHFNYNLQFSNNQNYTKIITAPNGYGKSTILTIIDKFSKNDFIYFIHLNFNEIKFHISNLSEPVTFKKNKGNNAIHDVYITHMENTLALDSNFLDFIANLENHLPIYKKGENIWGTFDDDTTITLPELFQKYRTSISISEISKKVSWLLEITSKLNINTITTNRLVKLIHDNAHPFSSNESKIELTVFDIQKKIKIEIQKAIKKQFQEGRYRETSFAKRLLEELDERNENLTNSIKNKINQINELEQKFISLGILKAHKESNLDNIQELLNNIHDQAGLKVLSIYLSDIVSKLSRLGSVAKKLELLKDTLDNMLSFKKVKFSLENGLEILSTLSKIDKNVQLSSLSSGEQHLILLLGRLIFETTKNSLVLIDEPEISFHPEWQESFINLINNIKEINNFSIIIATHSPSLINGNWDDVIELAELVSL